MRTCYLEFMLNLKDHSIYLVQKAARAHVRVPLDKERMLRRHSVRSKQVWLKVPRGSRSEVTSLIQSRRGTPIVHERTKLARRIVRFLEFSELAWNDTTAAVVSRASAIGTAALSRHFPLS